MANLLVIEYEEGCGYNCKTITAGDAFWASRRPFNRTEMQNRINRFLIDNPGGTVEQQLIYSQPFETLAHGGNDGRKISPGNEDSNG